METLLVSFPTLAEQTKIANFLSAIDEKINLLKQKHSLLTQYKKGLMQKLFSQQLRFKDDNGNDFPDWETKKLGEVVIEYNKKSTIKNEYVVLSSTKSGIFLQTDYFDKNVSSIDNSGYKIIPRGYLTYRSMSDTGSFTFNIQNIVDFGIVSPAYPVFKACDFVDNIFLSFHLNNSSLIINDLLSIKEGGTRFALSFSKFIKLNVNIPTLAEQTKIANFLSAIDEKINITAELIKQNELYKKGLMQKMFV